MPDFRKALEQLRPKQAQRMLFQPDSPVSSLRRQLAFLKSRPPEEFPPLHAIDGVEEVTPMGRHLVLRNVYGDDHYHGNVRLGRFSCPDLQRFMALIKARGTVEGRNAIVFLDTETTGIHGGTGMVPFLVGLGYFEDADFHMVQYFIRDFDEEPSMLLTLADVLQRFKLLITYNGSSFDVPLLETRFTLARLNSPFTDMLHVDLLPAARRLWRNGHGSCRLAALENRIVAFLRGADIPGGMIPRAYFDFLQRRSSAVISSVLRHNVHDVVSLAALTICACDRLTGEPAALDNPPDLYSLARILENTPEWRRALRIYEMAIQGGLAEPLLFKAQENLAVLSKRAGDHKRALGICEQLMRHSEFSMPAYEGAAIYYERIAGDPHRAMEVVDRALARLEDKPAVRRWRTSLQSRRERLRQKAIQF